MPIAKLKDISIYYEVYGKGVPLLLIGGLGSDSASWFAVVNDFSKYFQTIVFDNRGCGRSDSPNEAYSVSSMAEDTIKLLDFLKINKTHIIGHSMGGYIAQELAIKYPERVDKLILASSAPISSKRNNIFFKDIYNQIEREGRCEHLIRRWTFWLFTPKLFEDSKFMDMFITNSMKYPYSQKPEGFKNQVEAIISFDARDKIKNIKAKTLILEGKYDILITPEEAEILAQSIRGSTYQLLDGVAHCIQIENPKLFTDTALRFLNS